MRTLIAILAVFVFAAAVAHADDEVAYVMIGLADPSRANENAALKVAQRYRDAGYRVIFKSAVTQQGIQDAINDPKTSVIWYLGHGYKEGGFLSNWEEGISVVIDDPYDTNKPPRKIEVEVPSSSFTVPANNHIHELVLNACGQRLSSWADKFIHASFEGWPSYTTPILVNDWETYFHTIIGAGSPIFSPSGGQVPMDPRIRPNGDPFVIQPDGHVEEPSVFTDWHVTGSLLADYGAFRSFNFYTTGGGISTPQWNFSATMTNGYLNADDFDAPIAGASYDIYVDHDALDAAYMNRDTWASLFGSGLVTVNVSDQGLSSETAFATTGAVLFGLSGAEELPVATTPEGPSIWLLTGGALGIFAFKWRKSARV